MTFCETQHFYGKSSGKFLSHPRVRHNCVIDQSATENKVIHTLIIDFFSHRLRSVKIEQELEKPLYNAFYCDKRIYKHFKTWISKMHKIYNNICVSLICSFCACCHLKCWSFSNILKVINDVFFKTRGRFSVISHRRAKKAWDDRRLRNVPELKKKSLIILSLW